MSSHVRWEDIRDRHMPTMFRWKFTHEPLGLVWSRWHTVKPNCPACCCNPPGDYHQEAVGFYDGEGGMISGHTVAHLHGDCTEMEFR